jgi:hypothetical protein
MLLVMGYWKETLLCSRSNANLVGWNERGEERTGRVSNRLFSYEMAYGSGNAMVKMPMLAAAESLLSVPF